MTRTVLALKFGRFEPRPARQCFARDPGLAKDIEMAFFFWVICGRSPVVVDCGFDRRAKVEAGRILCDEPGRLLAEIGLDPADVETLLLTHLHYDHAGCLDLFPKARVFVHAAELEWCGGPAMADASAARHYRREHLESIFAMRSTNRVETIDDARDLGDGLSLHHAPGHTPGLMVVRIDDRDGPLVLASDAVHLDANLEQRNPFPDGSDPQAHPAVFDKLMQLSGGRPERVVPGHDPAAMNRFSPSRESAKAWVLSGGPETL